MTHQLAKWLVLVPVVVIGSFGWAAIVVGGTWFLIRKLLKRLRRQRVSSNAAEIRRLVSARRPRV